MKYNRRSYLRRVQFFLACALFAGTTQNAIGGYLFYSVGDFLSGTYPVATAYLDLYDSNGTFIARQEMDATGLLAAGTVDTGSELLFNGSLTFPDLYPFVAGDSGGALATVHDFAISYGGGSEYTDVVTMQIDWQYQRLNVNQPISHTWGVVVEDDFVNGIATNVYGMSSPPEALSYGSASFSLEFATGVAPVPLPATAWLLGSGIIGLLGFARRKAHS